MTIPVQDSRKLYMYQKLMVESYLHQDADVSLHDYFMIHILCVYGIMRTWLFAHGNAY